MKLEFKKYYLIFPDLHTCQLRGFLSFCRETMQIFVIKVPFERIFFARQFYSEYSMDAKNTET